MLALRCEATPLQRLRQDTGLFCDNIVNFVRRVKGYEVHTNDDGSQILTSIEFGGKKYALALGDDATMTESASQSSSQ